MLNLVQRKPIHHPQTASRVFSGEAVIITPAENKVRMLNPVGSRIWELADGTRTVDAIATMLAAEYEVDPAHARQSTQNFVADLVAKSLLSWS